VEEKENGNNISAKPRKKQKCGGARAQRSERKGNFDRGVFREKKLKGGVPVREKEKKEN